MLNRRKCEFLTQTIAREFFRIPRSIIYLSISIVFLCLCKSPPGFPFLAPFFYVENIGFGTLPRISSVPQTALLVQCSAKKRQKTEYFELRLATWCRPCFSRNHSNYCAVGTYWFSKRRCWSCFSMCFHKKSLSYHPKKKLGSLLAVPLLIKTRRI